MCHRSHSATRYTIVIKYQSNSLSVMKTSLQTKQAFFKTLGISSVIKFDRFVKMYCEIQLGNGFEWMKEEQTAQSDKIWNQQSYLVNNDFIYRMNKNVVDQYFTI